LQAPDIRYLDSRTRRTAGSFHAGRTSTWYEIVPLSVRFEFFGGALLLATSAVSGRCCCCRGCGCRWKSRRRSVGCRWRPGTREQDSCYERVQDAGQQQWNDVEDDQVSHEISPVLVAFQHESTPFNLRSVGVRARSAIKLLAVIFLEMLHGIHAF
jgi:hypothetical protein